MLLARFGINSPSYIKQVQVLHEFYDKNRYPTSTEKNELAQILNLSTKRVQHWFQWKWYKDKNKWLKSAIIPSLPLKTNNYLLQFYLQLIFFLNISLFSPNWNCSKLARKKTVNWWMILSTEIFAMK